MVSVPARIKTSTIRSALAARTCISGFSQRAFSRRCRARTKAQQVLTTILLNVDSNAPYHTPVFVLTHHPRAAVKMDGGTTFHFVTDGIHAALQRAKEEANGLDVRLGGGAATIRQYLQAGLVDELHVAVSPIILGSGESLFAGIDLLKLGYKCAERVTSPAALHMVLTKGTT